MVSSKMVLFAKKMEKVLLQLCCSVVFLERKKKKKRCFFFETPCRGKTIEQEGKK